MRRNNVFGGNFLIIAAVLSVATGISPAFAAKTGAEFIFKEKCAPCHPNGGNVLKANATLIGIKDPKKIINQIRKGGGAMPAFDTKTISDADSEQLAKYIIKKFK